MKYEKIEESIRSFLNYETKTGVKLLKLFELYRIGDIAFWVSEKTNKQRGFFIVYEASRNSDNWLWFCPSQNQIDVLIRELPIINNVMEKLREEVKNGKTEN